MICGKAASRQGGLCRGKRRVLTEVSGFKLYKKRGLNPAEITEWHPGGSKACGFWEREDSRVSLGSRSVRFGGGWAVESPPNKILS